MPFTLLKPDGIDLSQNFAFTGTVSGAGGGKINQVLQTERATATTIATTTYSSIGLSQAITPSATSSKIIIMGYVKFSFHGGNGDRGMGVRIRRDSTAIQDSVNIYDAYNKSTASTFINSDRFPFMYIDSPSSTSEITYSIRIASWNSQSFVVQNDNTASQIQCWELLA